MDLRCPKCNSTDLKKVSLAYDEGLFRTEARTRLHSAVVGGQRTRPSSWTCDHTGIPPLSPLEAVEPYGKVVLSEGRLLVRPGVSLRRLAGLLRQRCDDEF